MVVQQLFNQARDVLQDTDKNYWSDSELVDYFNNGIRAINSERMEEPTTTSVILSTSINEYTVNGVLRYISVIDSDGKDRVLYTDDGSGDDDTSGIIVKDYNRLYVNNPETGTTLTIKHIALPDDMNLSSDIRSGDEAALKYFVLSKAYEKECDMENFQKSVYFKQQYDMALKVLLKNSKLNYMDRVETTKGYYY